MNKNKVCPKCGKEFDSSLDFIEDMEMLEALIYYSEEAVEKYCNDCIYALDEVIQQTVEEFFTGGIIK